LLKSALVFLALNGHDFQAPEDDLAETVLAVVRGELSKSQVTVFLRRWSAEL
jgi:death-on-curing protein